MIIYILIFFLLFILLAKSFSLHCPLLIENFNYITIYELPKMIFTYWENEDENHIVNTFLQSWKNNIKG
jgi:hypothetical protein